MSTITVCKALTGVVRRHPPGIPAVPRNLTTHELITIRLYVTLYQILQNIQLSMFVLGMQRHLN